MASPSKPTPSHIQSVKASLPAYLSKTNTNISHLNRHVPLPSTILITSPISFSPTNVHQTPLLDLPLTSTRLLSSTSHLDTTLLTITYTLHFLHSSLPRLPIQLPIVASLLPSLPPLTSLIDEFRVFLRLWGLLGIYSWGVSVYNSPPTDWILKYIAWAQVGVNAVYQALENVAFLGDKGILRGVSAQTRARWWLWSSRAWMAHVGLECARLGREWILSHQSKLVAQRREFLDRKNKKPQVDGAIELRGEKEEKIAEREEKARWWREVGVNAAYAPMTVHWSVGEGILGEGSVGALGIVAGMLGIREAWRKTA